MTRRVPCLGLLLLSLAAACTNDTQPTEWHQEAGYRWRELRVRRGSPGFTAMSAKETGISFMNTVSDSALLGNRILGQGAGVALGDVDGDGLVDVFLGRTEGCSALYKNLGNWHFQDITQSAGVGACDRHTTGVAFADVDGDGDLDLVLLATKGPNAIFINDGKGHFTEHRDLGLSTVGRGGSTVTLSDVDGDGRLDMFVANYKPYTIDDSLSPQQHAFNQMVKQVGPKKFEVVPQYARDYKIVMRPDMGGLRLTQRGAPNEFYLNDGKGHFALTPMTSGRFIDTTGKPMAEDPESFTLEAKFVDLNGDGLPDLYVSNDFEDLDQLWFNDGHGHFRLAGWPVQRQTSNSAMGFDVGDINGDGIPDLFEVDMLANDARRLKTQIPTHTALPKLPGDIESVLQQQRNTLFLNRGDSTFAEIGMLAGIGASGWSWGTMFMDVDLDGRPDILIANGHLWDIMDADVQEGLQNRLNTIPWRRTRWQFPKLALKNVAYRNRGDLTFEDASDKWGFGTEADISHTLAAADLDGDGDLDVVVNRLDSPALILRNNASANRVAVRLIGNAPNTRAVGSRVKLIAAGLPLQEREVVAGGLYMSHSDYELSFAMGAADSSTLVVEWRDGGSTTMSARANRLYEIAESPSRPVAQSPSRPVAQSPSRPVAESPSRRVAQSPSNALFEDATPQLGGHKHVDPLYDDWARQFLLPNSLSQFGPGVVWFDYDRDGYEDLLIGTGRGGRLGVFHNDHGRLVPQPSQGPIAPDDLTGLAATAADGGRLIAGFASWEHHIGPSAVAIAANAKGVATSGADAAPQRVSSPGPIALADYNGDGTLDLFVGGRAIPGQYPKPATSSLYRNVGGVYVMDTVNTRSLADIGMVSAAMFADLDGDGHPDLVLAREWASIVVLFNRNGRFVRAPASWGLDKWTSRWIGIAAGDLDGDGRLDLVATSWGRNTMTPVDSTNPLTVVYGPVGGNGEVEPLLARMASRRKALVPITSYARARSAIEDLPTRVRSFAAYADATIDSVLGPQKALTRQESISTLDNMVFLNRGDHFEARPMPIEAQFAPASYAGVADFDGDGAEDVFLSQNFFPTAVGTPRYDEGRGLLLLGDGKGGLIPLSGARSGIVVYGDQRGAAYADYDGDGRLDLVVSQNGAATRLFHNRGAKPGLRVRLQGPASNPDGIGAQVRIVYGDRMGPVREIQAGSGYWSQNGAVQVFGLSGTPTAVWVRWPGGRETRTPVAAGEKEVKVPATSEVSR